MRRVRNHHGKIGARTANPLIELLIRCMNIQIRQWPGAPSLIHLLQSFAVACDSFAPIRFIRAGHIDSEASLAACLDMQWHRDSTVPGLAGWSRTLDERGAADVIEPIVQEGD